LSARDVLKKRIHAISTECTSEKQTPQKRRTGEQPGLENRAPVKSFEAWEIPTGGVRLKKGGSYKGIGKAPLEVSSQSEKQKCSGNEWENRFIYPKQLKRKKASGGKRFGEETGAKVGGWG